MKNKAHLALKAVVIALVAIFQASCNVAHSCNGNAVVNNSGSGSGYSTPGGWLNAGISLGPRQQPRQQCRKVTNPPLLVVGQQQPGWNQVCQQPYYGGGQQPFYGGGQQPYYGNGRIPAPYPQGDMGGGVGPGMGRGIAGWLSGGGRTAAPVNFNEGTSRYGP